LCRWTKVRIITTANDVIHAFAVPFWRQDAIPVCARHWFRAEKWATIEQCQGCAARGYLVPRQGGRLLTTRRGLQSNQRKQPWCDPSKIWTLADLKVRGEKSLRRKLHNAIRLRARCRADQTAGWISAIVVDADHAKQIMILLSSGGPCLRDGSNSDTDLAAVAAYTKNNWSNQTGQVVQPI
jgi:cytochrome c oxidase subunit 2